MDQSVVQTLVSAVTVVQSPSTSPEERIAAQKYCEDFKRQNTNCHAYGLYLSQSTNGDSVRHFGLHLIEHACKYQWPSLTSETHEVIKASLLKLLDTGTRGVLEEPVFLKEKLAAVISEVVKREWPQSWPEFLPGLGAATQNGPKQVELVLLTLKTIAEDASVYGEEMREERRKLVITGLTEAAPTLFSFFHATMAQNFVEIRSNSENGNGNGGINVATTLLVASLGALTAFADFVQPIIAFRDSANVVQACVALLTQEDDTIRTLACEFLLLLYSKRTRQPEVKTYYTAETPALLEQCSRALSASSARCGALGADMDVIDAEYRFQKRVCQLLSEVGILHYYALDDKPESRMQHASMMLALLEHPSLLLSSFTLNFWTNAARMHMPQKPSTAWLEQVLPNLLRGSANKYYKKGDPSRSGGAESGSGAVGGMDSAEAAASVYASFDFTTTEEWQTFYAVVKSRSMELSKLLARIAPVVAIESARSEVSNALSISITPGMDPADEEDAYCIVDAALSFSDSVIDGALRSFERELPKNYSAAAKAAAATSASITPSKSGEGQDQGQGQSLGRTRAQTPPALSQAQQALMAAEETAIAVVEQILVLVFGSLSQCTVPRHLARRIAALSGYSLFLRRRPQAMPQVIERLLETVAFRMPGEEDVYCEDLSVEAVGVRRKATEALRSLCGGLRDNMLPYLGELAGTVDLMAKEGRIRGQEHAMLVESVVAVSNGWRNYDRQTSLISSLCDSAVAEWKGRDITTALSSPLQLLELVGVVPEDLRTAGPEITKEYVRMRRLDAAGRLRYRILNLLCMYTGIVKRVTVPDDWRGLIKGGFVDAQQASILGVDLQHFRRTVSDAQSPAVGQPQHQHPGVAARWEVRPLKRQPFVRQLILHVLPNLLACIQSMHGLWTEEVRSRLPESFQSIFHISAKDRDSILGVSDDSADSGSGISEGHQHYLRTLGLWMSSVRDQALQLLGLLCSVSSEVYRAEGALQAILGAALSHLGPMQNRHLRVLLKWAVTPLLEDAPDEYTAAVEDAVLPALLEHFFQRIQAGWAGSGAIAGSTSGSGSGSGSAGGDAGASSQTGDGDVGVCVNDNDKNEILEDRALRDFTREYLDLLYRVLRPTAVADDEVSQYEGSVGRSTPPLVSEEDEALARGSGTPHKNGPQPGVGLGQLSMLSDLPVRCSHALITPAIMAPLLRTAIACLGSVPDSVVARKACNLCTRVVILLADLPQWHSVLGTEMLAECVRALAQPHNQENVSELFTLIALIYTNLSCSTSTALPAATQQQHRNVMHETLLQVAPETVTRESLAELDIKLAGMGPGHPSGSAAAAAAGGGGGSAGGGSDGGDSGGRGPSFNLRKQRTLFRSLLEDVVLSAAPQRSTRPRARTGNILSLPELMYVQSTQRRLSSSHAQDGPLDLEGGGDAELELLFGVDG